MTTIIKPKGGKLTKFSTIEVRANAKPSPLMRFLTSTISLLLGLIAVTSNTERSVEDKATIIDSTINNING